MSAQRLRDLPDLDATYRQPHDHRIYGRGHAERVERTTALALSVQSRITSLQKPFSAADLSCGNGAVLDSLKANCPEGQYHYGDYAPGYEYEGLIEMNLDLLPRVDLYVCGETLEHLENPTHVLQQIRASNLVLSTPVEAWGDTNPEHLWAWSMADVTRLMDLARWSPRAYAEVDSTAYGEPYRYGIWHCEKQP